MYEIQKIESTLELPYNLIDIDTSNEHFIFRFNAFDDNQTDYDIKMGGVTGEFGVVYQCRGTECCFGCDVTVGNVFDFYKSLDNAYDIMLGKNSSAFLTNYGNTLNRTNLTIKFDNKGHCFADGYFKNADNQYKSGIFFSFEIDRLYISYMIKSMDDFFHELIRIQGHNKFY